MTIASQLNCIYDSISSQANSMWEYTKDTTHGWQDSLEYYTDLVAQYIFNKNRSAHNRTTIVHNYIVPLLIFQIPIAYVYGLKASLIIPTIASIYTLVIAKQKGYF